MVINLLLFTSISERAQDFCRTGNSLFINICKYFVHTRLYLPCIMCKILILFVLEF